MGKSPEEHSGREEAVDEAEEKAGAEIDNGPH